jgi:hypothetical protein
VPYLRRVATCYGLSEFPEDESFDDWLAPIAAKNWIADAQITPDCLAEVSRTVRKRQPMVSRILGHRQSRIKAKIGQKYRTQKNECRIFLRSIFLPIQGLCKQEVGIVCSL